MIQKYVWLTKMTIMQQNIFAKYYQAKALGIALAIISNIATHIIFKFLQQ